MAQSCNIAILGFPEEISNEIIGIVEGSILDLSIDYVQNFEFGKTFWPSLKKEFDIIVLDPTSANDRTIELIKKIKSKYPLTEIVLVSFEDDYNGVVKAFRAGVRDVLSYPLDKNEFLEALEHSQSYRSLFQKSESLTDLISLYQKFSKLSNIQNFSDLTYYINQYLENKLNADSFLLLSYDKKINPEDYLQNSFRLLTKTDKKMKNYSRKNISQLLNEFPRKSFESGSIAYLEKFQNGKLFFIIPLGDQEGQEFLGLFSLDPDEKNEYFQKVIEYFSRLIQNSFKQMILGQAKKKLSFLIYLDDVTGLYNQRKLYLDLDYSIDQYEKSGEEFSIIFVDIDSFKQVNDGHGHIIGSKLLKDVSLVIKDSLRSTDYIYRYGGDEFVALLPNVDLISAKKIGERLLSDIKKTRFQSKVHRDLRLSVSIGISSFPSDASTKEEILTLADDMMYKAKAAGKGQVMTTSDIFKKVGENK